MTGLKPASLLALVSLMLGSAAWAQGRHGRNAPAPMPREQAPWGGPRQGPGGGQGNGGRMHGPGPHMGDWLRKHQDLSPEQQQKALEQDPDFQRLSRDRQDRLRQRLQSFNSLPPERKQRILQRMETWEHLTPEQQLRARNLFANFRALPPERRRALVDAFRELRDLSSEDQQKALGSDRFRNNFSDEERDLLRGMSEVGVLGGGAAPPPSPARPQQP